MDRRKFLGTIGVSAAATAALSADTSARNLLPQDNVNSFAVTPKAVLSGAGRNRGSIQSDLTPWAPNPGDWNVNTAGHLLRRAGFGGTQAEIAAALTTTYDKVIDALLDDTLLQDTGGTNGDGTNPTPPTNSEQWLHVVPQSSTNAMIQYSEYMMDIRAHWTMMMSQPKTMLRERMTLFWMNHFVVEEQKVYYPQLMYNYLNYFRRNVWGNFKQMVRDITVSPTMLIYLDGQYNVNTGPNENYARELQELFTMGVYDKDGNANYTQGDIEGFAAALSGWSVDYTAPAPNVMPSKYTIATHDSSYQKIYDGVPRQYNLTEAGVSMDMDLLDHMFDQRGSQIAWFICSELYQYLVYHEITTDAEKAIVQTLADTLVSSNWSIKAVLTQLLNSQHFFDTANIGACIKSPIDHLVGMVRQLDISFSELSAGYMYSYTYPQGQYILDPPNVKGWPGYHAWISTASLPIRNRNATLLTVSSGQSLPAGGTDSNGRPYLPVTLADADVLAWAKQFTNYNGDFIPMLTEVAEFLCAQPLGPTLLDPTTGYLVSKFTSNITYEWSSATDATKPGIVRQMMNSIMQLAEYQLS